MQDQTPSRRMPPSILVAQEDGIVSTFLTRVLALQGYRVLSAADAKTARVLFHKHARDLVLLLSDIVLPDESGLEFVESIPTRLPRIPVIFLSGLGENEVESKVRENFPVLQKPFTATQLLRSAKAAICRFYLDAKGGDIRLVPAMV